MGMYASLDVYASSLTVKSAVCKFTVEVENYGIFHIIIALSSLQFKKKNQLWIWWFTKTFSKVSADF